MDGLVQQGNVAELRIAAQLVGVAAGDYGQLPGPQMVENGEEFPGLPLRDEGIDLDQIGEDAPLRVCEGVGQIVAAGHVVLFRLLRRETVLPGVIMHQPQSAVLALHLGHTSQTEGEGMQIEKNTALQQFVNGEIGGGMEGDGGSLQPQSRLAENVSFQRLPHNVEPAVRNVWIDAVGVALLNGNAGVELTDQSELPRQQPAQGGPGGGVLHGLQVIVDLPDGKRVLPG